MYAGLTVRKIEHPKITGPRSYPAVHLYEEGNVLSLSGSLAEVFEFANKLREACRDAEASTFEPIEEAV